MANSFPIAYARKSPPDNFASGFNLAFICSKPFFTNSYTAEWDAAQPRERKLMIAIARLILSDLGSPCKRSRRESNRVAA
jgi:hypothetical protein